MAFLKNSVVAGDLRVTGTIFGAANLSSINANNTGLGTSGQVLSSTGTGIAWVNATVATSVKGNAESSYRTGQVNLTPANLGISATTTSVTVGSTTFNKYTHPTGDGNLHVPATGTGNNGKVLKAGSTAGSLSWGTLTAADVGLGNVANKTITVTSTSVSDGTNTFNKYTHPTDAGNKHIPSGGSSGQYLKYSASGTATWADLPSTMTPSSHSHGDINNAGTVTSTAVTPGNGDYILITDSSDSTANKVKRGIAIGTGTSKYLREDGTWQTVSTSDTKVTNTLATTTKYYVTGTTSNSTNTGTQSFDTGIYATTTAGELNATQYKVNEAVTLQYNTTTKSLDFIFA